MDRPIFNRSLQCITKNIPALSFAGVFFFSVCALAGSLELATDLFEKEEWALCRRECARALLGGLEPVEKFELLNALSLARSGSHAAAAEKFSAIAATNRNPQISAIAAYEHGRIQWAGDQPEQALLSFAFSFQTTTNKALFLRSGCSLFLLFEDHPKLQAGRDELVSQINTCRPQWFSALFQECAKPVFETGQPQAPNWLIRFYRSQISPGIGARCVLEPSCSEYYHQAHCKHGWKSIPMIADRLVREPNVSHDKADPVIMPNRQIRYRDPLENHDFWMKK